MIWKSRSKRIYKYEKKEKFKMCMAINREIRGKGKFLKTGQWEYIKLGKMGNKEKGQYIWNIMAI